MKKRFLIPVLLLLAALPGAAEAQRTPEQRIAEARRRAEAAGLPVQLLDSKVEEGRAKNVPADRIATAVERRLDALQRAREAMGGARQLTSADLSVGADAVDAGVAESALTALAAEAPPQSRAVAIAKLTELVRAGEASERALERVRAALSRGPEALRTLPSQAGGNARGRPEAPPGQEGRGSPGTRGRGRGQGGGPPASVPGPGRKPDRGNSGGNNGNGNGGNNGNGNGGNGKKP